MRISESLKRRIRLACGLTMAVMSPLTITPKATLKINDACAQVGTCCPRVGPTCVIGSYVQHDAYYASENCD